MWNELEEKDELDKTFFGIVHLLPACPRVALDRV
jgi:hypothetical protein